MMAFFRKTPKSRNGNYETRVFTGETINVTNDINTRADRDEEVTGIVLSKLKRINIY